MHLKGGVVVHSPTDLIAFLQCEQATVLDLATLRGGLQAPQEPGDALLSLIAARGDAHELAHLALLKADGRQVVEIPKGGDLDDNARLTEEAMAAGAEVIFQATFFDGTRRGHADFLIRNDHECTYDVVDTKIARRVKVPALLQMATYARHVERLTGRPPARLIVVTGDGDRHVFPYVQVAAYAAHVQARFEAFLADPPSDRTQHTVEPTKAACNQCRWAARCEQLRQAADDLSLVPLLTLKQRAELHGQGIATITQLAATNHRHAQQARLLALSRRTGQPQHEVLPHPDPAEGDIRGLLLLPAPSEGDLFLDLEGHPMSVHGQLEYLWGWVDGSGAYSCAWGHDPVSERAAFEQFIDVAMDSWHDDPGMHIYHYAPYEVSALKRLAMQHRSREAEVDQLLRGERLIDLYKVVRQGVCVGETSYSIKKLERFYLGGARQAADGEVGSGGDSVVEYDRWVESQDAATLEVIRAYNELDCASTLALRKWLEALRHELGLTWRPTSGEGAIPDDQATSEAETAALIAKLESAAVETLRPDAPLVERQGTAHGVMADLVEWHRREDKQFWWRFFDACDLDAPELVEHDEHLGGLGEARCTGTVKSSTLWRIPVSPGQRTKLIPGDRVISSLSKVTTGAVELTDLDLDQGWVEVKVGPKALAPVGPGLKKAALISNKAARQAIAEVATAMAEAQRSHSGAQALIRRVVPAGLPVDPNVSSEDALLSLRATLPGTVLAVQGPPGSGKTYVGAALIRALVRDGLTVGVTANSHMVIANLLCAIGAGAADDIRILQKTSLQNLPHPASDNNNTVEAAVQSNDADVIGGTTFFWTRPAQRNSVDVLIVDEAGQMSLANAVAAATAARAVVLLGDPQQLAQPTQAVHPGLAGRSALEHLIGDNEVMPDDQGVFLRHTWRMDPTITSFVSRHFYQGQLHTVSGQGRELQRADLGLAGDHGIHWVPVDHHDCQTRSDAEIATIVDLLKQVTTGTMIDCEGRRRPLTMDDVLIVAPYNDQVTALKRALPGIRVGTVDKFQGQEAQVVVVSLTSSSLDLAPRGTAFLLDLHRINVAVSRAKALTVVVGSATLADHLAPSPEDVRRLNALCALSDPAGGERDLARRRNGTHTAAGSLGT